MTELWPFQWFAHVFWLNFDQNLAKIWPKFAKILASITFHRVRHTEQVDSDLACKFEANWTKDEDFVAIFV